MRKSQTKSGHPRYDSFVPQRNRRKGLEALTVWDPGIVVVSHRGFYSQQLILSIQYCRINIYIYGSS